jgi:hypothetical protein
MLLVLLQGAQAPMQYSQTSLPNMTTGAASKGSKGASSSSAATVSAAPALGEGAGL